MAATSPYSPNDYQAVSNYRPYDLPINDIFKAISAQNQFWDAGAARVKAVYDNALNLKLSLEPNKEIRKKYLEDAEKQLTKLSSMDLSDPSVQRQGFALFKPLFQDEGIIFDDLTTRHYEKVRNDALMYRQKDNGKGYSDINMAYAMQGYNEFVNSQDRMAGKNFYQNRKEYTPYHDYTEDFSKALKDCKPSSIETTSPNYGENSAVTGYMKETYSKTLSAAQVRGCLEAGLSPNAQRQLQIEGSVSYRNNLPVLASDTTNYLSGVTGNLSARLQQLSASKAALATRKDLSERDKTSMIEALDNETQGVSEELDRANNNIAKLQAGDYTDLQNNFETYAGSVYSYKKLYKKALASAFEERRENYKADPVQLNAIKFSQDKYLAQMDFSFDVSLEEMKQAHDKEMKLMDLMYGGRGSNGDPFKGSDIYKNPLTGEVTINPNLLRETGNLTGSPETNDKVYEELTTAVSQLNEQDSTNNLRLYNNLISRAERDTAFRETLLKGFNFGTTEDEWTRFKNQNRNNSFRNIGGDPNRRGGIQETSWFKAYSSLKPDDEDVNKWAYENTIVQTGISVLNRKLELGEAQVLKELGLDKKGLANAEDLILQKVSSIKDTATIDGVRITAQDILNAERGLPSPVTIKTVKNKDADGENDPYWESYTKRYIINGKEYNPFTSSDSGVKALSTLNARVHKATETTSKDIDKKRIEVYNKLGFDREPWYFTPNDKAPILETLKAILPKDDKGKPMDVSIISSDFTGGIKVSIPGAKKGSDTHLGQIREAGIGTSVEATGDDVVTIRGTNYNLVSQAINNPVLAQAAYQLQTITETTSFAQTQPGAKVPNTDIKVPVMIRGKQEVMTIETYKNDTNPEFRVFLEGATDTRPFIIASNPYELFEKIGRSPMDFNKPIR